MEEKKTEEPKKEEAKEEEAKKPEKPAEEKKAEESKGGKDQPAPPPEIVLKVFMHCEGCARKVRRSLRGFPGEFKLKCHFFGYPFCDFPFYFSEFVCGYFWSTSGVEDVVTDCKSHKVVVKGEKADPLKVLERVQRKSHRQVELLSPIPKPPSEEDKKPEEKEKPKPEEKKEEVFFSSSFILLLKSL